MQQSFFSNNQVKDINPIVYKGRDTVMYAFNFDEGWVLLSADTRAKAMLASATEGSFEQQKSNQGTVTLINKLANEILELKKDTSAVLYSVLQQNEDYNFWHDMYLGYKASVGNEDVTTRTNVNTTHQLEVLKPAPGTTTSTLYFCKKLVNQKNLGTTSQILGNRMVTEWGQSYPWNVNLPFVPNADGDGVYPLVGCVAVAMGQVIYHSHYKLNTPTWLYHGSKIEGVYYNKKNYNMNFTQGQYVDNSPRWDLMAKDYSRFYSSEQKSYVAELFADLDWRLKMDYGYDRSGSNVSKDVMNQYGLTYDEGSFNSTTVQQNLINGLPVIITSFTTKSTSGWWFWKKSTYKEGHAWVIDGLREYKTGTKNTYRWCLVEVEERNDDELLARKNAKKIIDKPLEFEEVPEYYYTSLSEVYRDFETVMTYSSATNCGKKTRQEESSTTYRSSRKFLMNWGWDGCCDDNEYELTATQWQGDKYNFQYNTKIYYNLRKK